MKTNVKRSIFNNLFVLMLLLPMLFSLIHADPARAATINVPTDYATIQEAIAAAAEGDTITVDAGTYNENIVIDKGLTLEGASGATISPTAGPGIEVDVSTREFPVTIDGFTIEPQGTATDSAQGIVIGSATATLPIYSVTISNNTITTQDINMGILVRGAGTDGPGYPNCEGLNVIDNDITVGGRSTALYADWVTPAHTGWTIAGNTFDSADGVNLELYDVENVTVDDNIFAPAGAAPEESGSVFIGPELNNISSIRFTNNDVQGNATNGGTMVAFLCNFPVDGDPSAPTNTMDDVTIAGNTFDNWDTRAVGIFPGVTNVEIHQNNFLGTSAEQGLRNTSSQTVDASLNWWNSVSGPSHDSLTAGAGISTGVDYQPWLTAQAGHVLSITSPFRLPVGALGSSYSESLAAIGGTGPYTWGEDVGFPGWLSISPTGVITGTPDVTGTYDFSVQVRDTKQGIARPLQIFVPTTPLSIDTTSLPGGDTGYAYSQTLQASGGTGSYIWSIVEGAAALPDGLSLNASTGEISGNPTTAGTSYFTVQVDSGTTVTRALSIYISNTPPSITETSLPSGNVDVPYSQTFHATGGSLDYVWSVFSGTLPAGLSLNADTGEISGTPTTQGTTPFTIRVSDGYMTDDQGISLTINPPVLTITTDSLLYGNVGISYSQTLQATGGYGTNTWSIVEGSSALPPGLTLTASTGLISGTPTAVGDYAFTARVNDGHTTADNPLSISVYILQKLFGTSVDPATPGPTLADNIKMSRFSSIVNGNVEEIRVKCNGTGNVKVALYTDDAGYPGNLINANETGAAVIAGWNTIIIPETPVTLGTYYWIAVNSTTTCVGRDTLTGSSIVYLAANYSNPFPSSIGSGTIISPDQQLLAAAWGIQSATPLTIITTSLPNGTAGVSYSQTLQAVGGTGSYTWSIVEGAAALPPGLSLNTGTGLISGTPTAGGTYGFTAQVDDGSTHVDLALSITVNVVLQKLVGADDATASLSLGAGYMSLTRFQAVATGNVVTFKVKSDKSANVKVAIYDDSSGEPGALKNAVDTGTPIVTGWNNITIASTPVIAGTYYWLAIDSDTTIYSAMSSIGGNIRYKSAPYSGFTFPNPAGTGFSSGSGVIVLLAGWGSVTPAALTITTTSLPDGTRGIPYSQTLQATGGTGSYTWSLFSGSLPPGLGPITSGGLISGTPTTAGPYSFTARVDDGSTHVDQLLSITINEPPPLSITTASLPGGTVGVSYSQTLQATGGTGSYTWSIAEGAAALPPGLSLNTGTGLISGTPTAGGTYNFTARVNDGLTTVDQPLSIVISGIKLVGADDLVGNLSLGAGYMSLTRFQAAATGNMVTFKVKSDKPAMVKVAIYADSAGQPGALLNAVDTDNPVVAGWNNITIASTPITSGTNYWLAINSNTAINCAASSLSGTLKYKAAPYAGFTFPNPAGTGFSSASGVIDLLAGWGNIGSSPLTINTTSLPAGNVGTAYAQTLLATGGTGSYNWSITSGSLPDNLNLTASTGLIFGTPTTVATSGFTVQVNDGSTTASLPLSITINPRPPLTITTTSLPGGSTGVSYSQTLQAIGGSGSYSWSLFSGSLPPGLGPMTSGGLISGTPTAIGTYDFTVQVNDGITTVTSVPLSIVISALTIKLVGADDATASLSLGAGYMSLTRFQAAATGNMNTFKVKSDRSASVKVAIYSETAGQPGNLLRAVNTGTPIVAGWNDITIASTPVTAGTYYWLAINSDTTINCAASSLSGTLKYKAAPYAGFTFPNPAGTGYSTASSIICLLAGWSQ
jgi:hypothetical protein